MNTPDSSGLNDYSTFNQFWSEWLRVLLQTLILQTLYPVQRYELAMLWILQSVLAPMNTLFSWSAWPLSILHSASQFWPSWTVQSVLALINTPISFGPHEYSSQLWPPWKLPPSFGPHEYSIQLWPPWKLHPVRALMNTPVSQPVLALINTPWTHEYSACFEPPPTPHARVS